MTRLMSTIIMFVMVLCTYSCKDFLIEKPKNFISTTNFYNTAEDAEAAVLGIYSANAGNGPFWGQLIELHADYTQGRGSWLSTSFFDQILDQGQIDRAAGYFFQTWYLMINRANSALANVPGIKMDENKKKSLLAEAHFMRAMGYFDLVRGYGPIPLRVTPTTDLANIAAPRAPEQEVYNLIIEDLKLAENELPESVGPNTRRASKWAAKLLLAQVYLTLEEWGDAAAKADEVIRSNKFKLVSVTTANDFYKLFAVNTSTEDIMSWHFSETNQDYFVQTLHLPNIPAYNNSSEGFYTTMPLTTSFIGKDWNNNDLRKRFNLYTEYVNSSGVTVPLPSATPILFKKFIAQSNGIRSNSRPLLRLAEAYLIYAEAQTMADGAPSDLALERLNVIKRRAYGYDPDAVSPVDYPGGMTSVQFRDSVIQERGYEFLLEQRRWWDLKRTGKAKEYIGAAHGVTFNDYRLLFPIPEDEINNNTALSQADQNPGY